MPGVVYLACFKMVTKCEESHYDFAACNTSDGGNQ